MPLSSAQELALSSISEYAIQRKEAAIDTISHILRMSNLSESQLEEAFSHVQQHARVAIHFHPDRPDKEMRTVAQALLEDGQYKSQFDTHISNGSVSAYPGGARDLWENEFFGGAYHIEGVMDSERPKYGSLDLMLHPDGPSPRFGCCYFLLKPQVSQRCTFSYLDSHMAPPQKGTLAVFHDIMAALMSDAFSTESVIGKHNMRPPQLLAYLCNNLHKPFSDPSQKAASRNLDHYIEAQVHGDVSLDEDVDFLVADPSFHSTDIGKLLEQIAETYQIKLFWHQGFALAVSDVPPNFRGPSMPSLAQEIEKDQIVSPYIIGQAAMNLKENPPAWSHRGTYEEVLQELKLMWHVLVRYGVPFHPIHPSS